MDDTTRAQYRQYIKAINGALVARHVCVGSGGPFPVRWTVDQDKREAALENYCGVYLATAIAEYVAETN